MRGGSSSKRAYFVSIEVFAVLVGGLVYARKHFSLELEEIDPHGYLFFLSLLSIGLLTIVVFQSFKISDSAKNIATKMARDILNYSHELFSELYRGSPVPYILVDHNGIVTSMNPSAIRLFNCSEGDFDGKNIFDFIEGDDEQKVALIPEKLKQGLFVNDAEVRIARVDASSRWVLLSLFSFKDSRGSRNGLLTLVDITKQKEIDKAKTEFVSLASHQLRTPISAMKWNIELLTASSKGTFTPAQEEYVRKLATGAGRMENLISDFLSASKFELGTLTADLKDMVLQECLADIFDEQYERARKHNISLRVEVPEEPIRMVSDSHLLTMSIGNLLSNAIKYTPDGGIVRLRVELGNDQIAITVSDTGMGIPLDEQGRLFEKIFRASNARSQVAEGTGLGLYIAREAILILGGKISFVSKENVGTTFTIILPMS